MNELINIIEREDGSIAINGRELYDFLRINSNYSTWFKRMIDYGFKEGEDFIPFLEKSQGGRPTQGHALSIEMAKEIAMIQRNEKGKEARLYFIEIEKRYRNELPMSFEDIMIATLQEMKGVKSEIINLKSVQEKQEIKINDVLDKVTLSSKQVSQLVSALKRKLDELTGRPIKAGDFEWKMVKRKLFMNYQIKRWEEIPVSQYYAVFADIDSIEDIKNIQL